MIKMTLLITTALFIISSVLAVDVPLSPEIRTLPFVLISKTAKAGKIVKGKKQKQAEPVELIKYGCKYDEMLAFKLESLGVAVLNLEEIYYIKIDDNKNKLKDRFKIADFAFVDTNKKNDLEKYYFVVFNNIADADKKILRETWSAGLEFFEKKKDEAKTIISSFQNGSGMLDKISGYDYRKKPSKDEMTKIIAGSLKEFDKTLTSKDLYKKLAYKALTEQEITTLFFSNK